MTKTSTLTGSKGEVKLVWTKADGGLSPAQTIAAFKAAVKSVPPARAIAPPKGNSLPLLTLHPSPDLHIGMLVWTPECGKSWDLEIEERAINDAADRVVSASPPSDTAIVL